MNILRKAKEVAVENGVAPDRVKEATNVKYVKGAFDRRKAFKKNLE